MNPSNSNTARPLPYKLRMIVNDNEPGGTGGEWVGCDRCGTPIYGELTGHRAVICPLCNGLTQLAGAKQKSIRKVKGGAR